MEIILHPGEVAKIEGFTGQLLEVNEVLLRAVSLLKTIINVSWDKLENAPGDNKENLNGQNTSQNGEIEDPYQIEISN